MCFLESHSFPWQSRHVSDPQGGSRAAAEFATTVNAPQWISVTLVNHTDQGEIELANLNNIIKRYEKYVNVSNLCINYSIYHSLQCLLQCLKDLGDTEQLIVRFSTAQFFAPHSATCSRHEPQLAPLLPGLKTIGCCLLVLVESI